MSNYQYTPGPRMGVTEFPNKYDTVEEVHVRNCSFTGTQNAARIKTWQVENMLQSDTGHINE
jgi:hypothetical protein